MANTTIHFTPATIILALCLSLGWAPSALNAAPIDAELTLNSTAFTANGRIPRRYTCEGADISPQLAWSEIPKNTQSLALIVEDPDVPDPAAPRRTWVHWVLYNIPATVADLPDNSKQAGLPKGTKDGKNDWRRAGYGGPSTPLFSHPLCLGHPA